MWQWLGTEQGKGVRHILKSGPIVWTRWKKEDSQRFLQEIY
jgi:hypothetical protein